MTAQELMIPRFEVIAEYPGSQYRIGDIMRRIEHATNDWYSNYDDCNFIISLDNLKKYPYLFRPMNWWEMRSEDEMPRKVISKASPISDEIYEVLEWDMNLEVGWLDENKRSCCNLTAFKPEYGYFPVD